MNALMNKYQGHRLPYLMKIALLCIGFLLIIPVSSAETLKVISNTDICVYQPHLDKDRCKTVYELCDPSLDMKKVDFKFKTEYDDSLKITIEDLSYIYSTKTIRANCMEITIEGFKNPYIDVDNVLCYGTNCHEKYIWWDSSFIFKYPINASTSVGEVTMLVLLNDTAVVINNTPQYIWCNYTVNTTRRIIGYLYFTNETFYRCVDATETVAVATIIDEGNGTRFGDTEGSLILWLPLDCTGTNCPDISIYENNGTAVNTPARVTGLIGHAADFNTGSSEHITLDFFTRPSELTISAWIKDLSDDGTDRMILTWGSGSQPDTYQYEVAPAGKLAYAEYDGVDFEQVLGDTVLDTDTGWWFVTLTRNDTVSQLYVNGVPDGSPATTNVVANVDSSTIGARRDSGTMKFFFNGIIDNVMVWNRTLSPIEIMANYNNTNGTHSFAPLAEIELLERNSSLLAIGIELPDFVFSDSEFVDASVINFNTTAPNTSFMLLSSMNIEKLTAGGTNVISVRMILDSNGTVLEEDIRTVTGTGDIGSSGTSPVLFSVASGQHNITYQFKRTGPGIINISNFDFNMIQFVTEEGNAVRNQLIFTDYNHTDTSFTTAFNWTMNKTLNSSTFMLIRNTLTKSGTGSTNATYFFENLETGDVSPFWQRFLSDPADVGSVSGIYIDPSEVGLHNHSIQSRQSDAGDIVFVNGTLIDFDLIDSDNFTIPFFQDSNASTNLTNSLTLGAGTHLLVESTVLNLNGNSYFISFFSSFSSTTGSQTPRYFIDSPNLSSNQCFTEKQRYLSDNDDIGNSFAYTICEGLSFNTNFTFRLWVEVEAGESLIQLDENLLGFEAVDFSITEGELAPIATAITNPVNGSNASGSDTITWIAFFDPNGDLVTYNITLLDPDGTLNATIGLTNSTNFDVNWDSFDPGFIVLRVEGCDPGDLCSDTNISITIVPTPIPALRPSSTFCEDDILRSEVNTRTISNGNITDEITITRVNCIHGCSNATISAFGDPGCIESDLVLSLVLIAVVLISVFSIRRIL